MRKTYLLLALLLGFTYAHAQQAQLGAELKKTLDSGTQDWLRITLVFQNQLDFQSLLYSFEANQTPLDLRAKTVIREAMRFTSREQAPVLQQLSRQAGVRNIRSFWITNVIELEARPNVIADLRSLAGIAEIERADAQTFMLIQPVASEESQVEIANGVEPGLITVGARFMWNLGYTGRNRKAMLFDTGVYPNHPAFQGRYLGNRFGNTQSWLGFDLQKPGDKPGSHGTHVIGTILGLDRRTNDTVGLAPNAYFIATDPIVENLALVRPWTELILPFQWALNPDGDTSTTADIPDVINNSWGRFLQDTTVCSGIVTQVIAAVEAAGIANVFSAGNNGPGFQTIGSPAQMTLDTLSIFSVAALDANNLAAGFSSRGPTRCFTDLRTSIKPEVAAPGVNIRSANGPTAYGLKSGTSMASPHVSGCVLLLKEAFPMASGRQILNALYQTATDLGDPGEDNVYGTGLINLQAAYSFLSQQYTPASPAQGQDVAIRSLVAIEDGMCYLADGQHFSLKVAVENKGSQPISNFTLRYTSGSASFQQTFNRPLAVGVTDTVVFSPIPLPLAGQTHSVQLRLLSNGVEVDTINNLWREEIFFPVISTAVNENFSNTAAISTKWQVINPDQDGVRWDTTSTIVTNGGTTGMAIRLRESTSRNGQLDYLYLPPVLLTPPMPLPPVYTLSFDIAYNNRNSVFKDSLFVEASGLCSTWKRIFASGGDSLKTYTLNTPTQSSHWRTIQLRDTLAALIPTNGIVRVRIVAKNDLGGNMYLTNVRLESAYTSSIIDLNNEFTRVYPNPITDELIIESLTGDLTSFELLTVDGKKISPNYNRESSSKIVVHTELLENGLYFVRINAQGKVYTQKIVKL